MLLAQKPARLVIRTGFDADRLTQEPEDRRPGPGNVHRPTDVSLPILELMGVGRLAVLEDLLGAVEDVGGVVRHTNGGRIVGVCG